ncbi:hypothetical protein D3C80_1017290 [compost metagenome]
MRRERQLEVLPDLRRKVCHLNSRWRRLHLRVPYGVREAELFDGLFNPHISRSLEAAREWMSIHAKNLKDSDREPKCVVIGRTDHALQRLALQLRRCVLWDADDAQVLLPVLNDLERVRVNKRDGCLLRNQNTALIDIANNATGSMNLP